MSPTPTSAGAADVVRELAAPLAAAAEVDLLDVQVKGSGTRQLVRVVVDRKGGVDLGSIQRLSQELSRRLDEADPIKDRYSLEVTSPGTDHPLRTRADFARVEGRALLVHRDGGDGHVVQVRGTLEAAEEEEIVVRVDDEAEHIPYRLIVKATQSLPW